MVVPRARFCTAGLLGLLLSVSLSAQPLPLETWRLANGLTVVVQPDPSLPMVSVDMLYAASLPQQPPGQSGLAHLLEHLLFAGSQTGGGGMGEYSEVVEAGGGFTNGVTCMDYAHYYSDGPRELLPTLLWIEARRMADQGRALTEEQLEREKAVAINERRENTEETPYGRLDLALYEAMYPTGHPYALDIVGRPAEVRALTLQDVRGYLCAWYTPANACLAVVGDVDAAQVKPLVERLFGGLPALAAPPRGPLPAPRRDPPRRLTLFDDVERPRLTLAWHSPGFHQPGDAEMDALALILAGGPGSRLQRRLAQDEPLAGGVEAVQWSQLEQSVFRIDITAETGADRERLEAAARDELARLLAEGPTPGELRAAKVRLEREHIEAMTHPTDRAERLNAWWFYGGDPDGFQRDLARYRSMTPEGLRDAARRVLVDAGHVAAWVLPRPEVPDERPPGDARQVRAAQLPETFRLANGLTVHHWRRPGLPLVAARLCLPGGAALDGPGQAGRSTLALALLAERDGLRDELERLGARMDTAVDAEAAAVSLQALAGDLEPALRCWSVAVAEPITTADALERVRRQALDDLRAMEDDAEQAAAVVASRALWGPAHPLAAPVSGTPGSLTALSVDAVRAAQRQMLQPARAVLLVAGDVDRAVLEPMLARTLGGWRSAGPVAVQPALAAPVKRDGPTVLLVPRPGAAQTTIRWVWAVPGAVAPGRARLAVLNEVFGRGHTSRLNANLRGRHGWTYACRSYLEQSTTAGCLAVVTAVDAAQTAAALREIVGEAERIRTGGIAAAERDKAVAKARMRDIEAAIGLPGLLAQAAGQWAAGLRFDAFDRALADAATVTAAELDELAAEAIDPGHGVLVLVGDPDVIAAQWSGVDLPQPSVCGVWDE